MYRRLLDYARPYWFRFGVGIFLAVVVSLANGAIAYLVKPLLDSIFMERNMVMLQLLPLLLILVFGGKGVATYGHRYLMLWVGERVVQQLRSDLYRHLLGQSLSFFHRHPSSTLMSRIVNDASLVSRAASKIVADLINQSFTMVLLLGVAFYRQWQFTLISILVFPAAAQVMNHFGKKLRLLSRRSQERIADLNEVLQESFTGIKVVKAFTLEASETEKFQHVNGKLFRLTMRGIRADEVSSPLMEILGALGLAAVLWYGGSQVIHGAMTPGTFFSSLTALMMMYAPVRKLTRISNAIQVALGGADRIFALLDARDLDGAAGGSRTLQGVQRDIAYRNVSFTYRPEDGPVLTNVSITVRKGELVALVGPSGAGKTTFVDLLPRFYECAQGSICIDGIEVRDFTLESLRRHIGVVPQVSLLFNDTIHQNILYGQPDASAAEVREAARLAFADEFIDTLAAGYETVVGENGVTLSGGQRQRLCIARTILKNPTILILDEATSQLDSESEAMVQRALDNLMKERTSFVIAHRLSTVIQADRILLFERGRLIDQGPHDQLLARSALYQRLYEQQFKVGNGATSAAGESAPSPGKKELV